MKAKFHPYQRGFTPYHWQRSAGGGWRIGYGVSSFLIAQGSGFSLAVGLALLKQLQDEHRRPQRRGKQ